MSEFAYALQNKMAFTLLQNKEGNFVAPSEESFKPPPPGELEKARASMKS